MSEPTEPFGVLESLTPDAKQRMMTFLNGLLEKAKSLPGKLLSKDKKEKENNSGEQRLEAYFNRLTLGLSLSRAKEISKNQRISKLMTHNEFNYGQIVSEWLRQEFTTVRRLMSCIRPHIGSTQPIFYDLGSGTGKMLMAAALSYPFRKCIGIEILNSLYEQSRLLMQKVKESSSQIQQLMDEIGKADYELPELQVYNSDFRQADWSDASVVFASSTCYSPTLMRELSYHSRKLKEGSIFATLTKKLGDFTNESSWQVIDSFEGETSWGSCTIYVQVKLN